MDLQIKILKVLGFSNYRPTILCYGKLSYLTIVFTERKVGAHLAMPIKGNVHLLFHYVQNPRHESVMSRAVGVQVASFN